MIHSIFILNSTGEVIIEKHYRGNTSRTESSVFWSRTAKSSKGTPKDVPPVLHTPKGAIIHLERNGLFFLASVLTDTQPLFVTQFLSNLAHIFEDYFGELNEHAIKDNFITVYELLDEMLDNGFPLTVEPNTLKELIAPPNMLNRVFESLGGESQKSFVNTPSTYPWRRSNVKYVQNEIFVDVVETLNATFEHGRSNLAHLLVQGVVSVNSRLSGQPNLTMRLGSSVPLDDVALHHCVDLGTYAQGGSLCFVPPDGPFELMKYTLRESRGVTLPIEIQCKFDFDHASAVGSVSVSLIPRFSPQAPSAVTGMAASATAAGSMVLAQVMSAAGAKPVAPVTIPENIMENVIVKIPFGSSVTGSSLSANYGTVAFDAMSGTCTWNIGPVPRGKTPSLVGNVTLCEGSEKKTNRPPVLASFKIPFFSASGIHVESLELLREKYKYYKGLRCITKAGLYEVRT